MTKKQLVRLLREVRAYIEFVEEELDRELGNNLSANELIAANKMPDVYYKVVRVIEAAGQEKKP